MSQWLRQPLCINDLRMPPVQKSRFRHSARMGDYFHFVHQVAGIAGHSLCLVGRIEALLQVFVVCGNAGGAGILVALQ